MSQWLQAARGQRGHMRTLFWERLKTKNTFPGFPKHGRHLAALAAPF
jgi:hypothetical protein